MSVIKRYFTIILFSAFPILFVYFRNKNFIVDGGLWLPLLLATIAFSFSYFILNLFSKKLNNNLLIIILIAWWFLLYGHVYKNILNYSDLNYHSLRHRFFLPVYSILFIIPIYFLIKKNELKNEFATILLIIGIALNSQFLLSFFNKRDITETKKEKLKTVIRNDTLPDVYFIILDSYTNKENLQKYYNFDNSQFVDNLKKSGFIVFDNAKSNYPHTHFSIPSILNMEYINYFEDSISDDRNNENLPYLKMNNNKTVLKK